MLILLGMVLLGAIQFYLLFVESSSNHPAIEHKQDEFVPERTIEKQNTVYITESGAKYHRADCYTIKRGGVPITREEAEELGKEPCKTCRPND